MKLKIWLVLALVAICLICVTLAEDGQHQKHQVDDDDEETSKNDEFQVTTSTSITVGPLDQPIDGADGERHNQNNEQRKSHSLFGMLLSPIRRTFERARSMLSSRLGGGASAARDIFVNGFDELQTRSYKLFMRAYNKTYAPEELPRRMRLFLDRRKLIEQSVRDFASGSLTFFMRENSFLDWDESELKQLARASPPVSLDEMSEDERAAAEASASAAAAARDNDDTTNQHTSGLQLISGLDPSGSEDYIEWSTTGSDDLTRVVKSGQQDTISNLTVRATERIPAKKDWRLSGCVAAPLNQLKCGACYAIATVGALESQRCINQVSSSPVLSPQQVVDCSRAYKNFGCDGGWPTRVLEYLRDTRVIARDTCYPFVRRANTCRLRQLTASSSISTSCTVSASARDATQLNYKVLNNERDILYHVAKTGPVIAVMRATDKFLYYGSGIFDDPKCTRKRDDVDHAIVIVGYGRENNIDYWLIKNSWGTTDWGEGGYGKYKRGTNACSIGHWGWVITS